MGLCPNSLHPLKGPTAPQGLAAHIPMPIAGKVTVPGDSSNFWELPQCAPATPTRTLLIQLPYSGSSRCVPGGPGVSRQCGCKPPHGPGICVLPRLPSQSLEQPRGGPGLVEGRGGQVFPYNGTSLCALRSYSPPPRQVFPPLGDSTPANLPCPSRALSRTRRSLLRGGEGELAHAVADGESPRLHCRRGTRDKGWGQGTRSGLSCPIRVCMPSARWGSRRARATRLT